MAEYVLKEDILKYLEKKSSIEISTNSVIGKDISRAIDVLYCDIENMSAADVQPVKRGNWVQIGEQSAKCTECGGVLKSNGIDKTGKALIFNAVYHYCPCCGARMDLKDGEDNE